MVVSFVLRAFVQIRDNRTVTIKTFFIQAVPLSFRIGSIASILACPRHVRLGVIPEMPVVRSYWLKASVWTLKHDPEKWAPVFRKDHAQTKR
jgi:hypothetical protein